MAKERIALFDNVKGLAIVLVVVGHFGTRIDPVYESHFILATMAFIWTFHMPLFIFCSGLFAGRSWYKSRKAPADKALLYLALYVVFILCIMALQLTVFGQSQTVNPFDAVSAPWFMLTLAAYMLMVPLIGSVNPVAFMVVSIFVATLSCYDLPHATAVSLARLFVYLPYFAFGFYLQPQRVTAAVDAVRKRIAPALMHVLALAALAAIFAGMCLLADNETLRFIKALSSGSDLFGWLTQRYGYSTAFLVVARLVEYPIVVVFMALVFLAMPKSKAPLLTMLGQRSFQVYMVHMLFIYAFDAFDIPEQVVTASVMWDVAPWVLGTLLAVLLALPKFLNTWVQMLGAWCKRVTAEPQRVSS